jgi:NAD(P)-dependent dehydrogenase (short-subunit alcohol dehydrogenase family)
MTTEFVGKVAVITGGNQGIGRAIALAFASAGASVAIAARTTESLESTGAELDEIGAEWLAATCDVSDPAAVDLMGSTVLERFGRADIVVANAGIPGPTKPAHQISTEEWRECISVDLDGVFFTFRRFIPALIQHGTGGSLIAVSSVTGKRPLRGRTPYAAAKMGLLGLVRTLAAELGEHQIRVNSVCPGAVAGPRFDRVVHAQATSQAISDAEALRQFIAVTPLERAVTESEVADACAFLASNRASAITGEDLNVSGGLAMY